MKRLLTTALLLLCSVAQAQLPDSANPHKGWTNLIDTTWDHKDGKRYLPPKELMDAYELMKFTAAVNSNGNNFVVHPDIRIVLKRPEKWTERDAWGIYEEYQLEHSVPTSALGSKYIKRMNPDTWQWLLEIPDMKDATGKVIANKTYGKIYELEEVENRKAMHWMGQVPFDRLTVLNRSVSVSATKRLTLNDQLTVYPTGGNGVNGKACIALHPSIIEEKNGVKYLRVTEAANTSKRYGIKLESLDW